jgi:hypothetical protein
MRDICVWLGALMLAGAGAAGAHPPASVDGRWDLTIAAPHGKVVLGLDLNQSGEAVTGALLNFRGQDFEVKGRFSDGQLTLVTSNEEVALSGRHTPAGSLEGVLSTAHGDLTWTAVRVKP